jgi:DNA-binding SARP family transcriptional activator
MSPRSHFCAIVAPHSRTLFQLSNGGMMGIKVNVLGVVEALDGERDVTPSAPKIRRVLALLALRCGRVVPADLIIEELWGENPPKSAMTTLQTYIYQLRRTVFGSADGSALVTRSPGYQLNLPPEDVDLWRFRTQLDSAEALIAAGRTDEGLAEVNTALELWRGRALADVACGPLLEGQVAAMNDAWLGAVEVKFEAELELGTHANLIGQLRELITSYPLNEKLHALLMLALNQSSRRAEALTVYQEIRTRLCEELGSEPSEVLRRAQAVVLGCADDTRTGHPASANPAAGRRVPAQLPPDIADFTGRAGELSHVVQLLRAARPDADSCRIVSVTGTVGVGKSCLAVRAAHQVKRCFPDGQLYAEMLSHDGTATCTHDVLGGFLRALGVAPRDVPESRAARSGMFRSELSARSMLIVLDQVEDAEWITPLLPVGSGNAVLITNRRPLHGLPMHEVELGTLPTCDARALFSAVAHAHHVEDEPEDVAKVVELCGRLPLAIRAAAERLNMWSHLSLGEFAMRLEQRRDRLAELRSADTDIAARIDLAYRSMDSGARQIFHLLSLSERGVVADAGGQQPAPGSADLETIMSGLLEARLVEYRRLPNGRGSYRLPELVRLYALDQLAAEHTPPAPDLAAS